MVPELGNLYHSMLNILLDNLFYEKYFVTLNRTISIKGELFLNRINLTKTFCVYQSVSDCAHDKHRFIRK